MSLLALLLAAAPTSDKPSGSLLPGAETFDLKLVKPADRCARPSGDEIVVCGRAKNDDIAIGQFRGFEEKPLKAELGLGGGVTIDSHAEQHGFPDGRSAPALMFSLKIPF